MRYPITMLCHNTIFLATLLSGPVGWSQDQPAVAVQNAKVPEWHRALVKVTSRQNRTARTGIIVQTNQQSALILTVWEYRGDQTTVVDKEKLTFAATTPDGDTHELEGNVDNYLGFSPIYTQTGATGYFAVVEVKHGGLQLRSVKLAETVAAKGSSVRAVLQYRDDENESPVVQNVTISNDLNPAVCHPLLGEITGSDWSQQGLLSVHSNDGTLLGIANSSGGGLGGGGFGGGSGGGFFSIPDPRAQSENVVLPPLTFVAVADNASQLRELGVPVSDKLIALQKQRQRIHRDSFGRPIQSKNIQITWSDNHQELHGFSTTRGEWSKLKIDERDVIIPIVSANVGAVSLAGSIAAYSGEKGVWDIVNLRPGSQVPPSVSNDVVTVRDGKNYYTFAASSGVWTSPTDVNYQKHEEIVEFDGNWDELNRLMRQAGNRASVQSRGALGGVAVTGIKHHVDAAVEILRTLPNNQMKTDGDEPAQSASNALTALLAQEAKLRQSLGDRHPELMEVRQQIEALRQLATPAATAHSVTASTLADSESIELARNLRDQENPDSTEVDRLRQLVTESFEERLNQQQELAAKLERRFEEIRRAIESRRSNRDRIIERRVEELLDPTIEWSKLEPNQDTGNSDVQVADVPVDLSGVVMLEFTASYCQPCQQMIPVMQRLRRDGFPIQTIDVTAQPEVSRRHNVDRIPTLIVMVRGKEVERLVGVQSDAKLRRIMNDAVGKLEETALSQAKQAIKSVGRTAKGSLDRTTVGKQVAIRFTLPREVPLMHDHPRIDSLSLIPSDGTVEIDASGTATQLAKLYRQILNDLDDSDEVVASFAVPTGKLKPIEGEGIHAAVTGFGYRGTKAELAFFDEFLNWVAPRLNDSTTTPDDFANKSLEIQRRQGRLPGAGMPATETPAGLPRPPHVPTGGPGVRSPEARQ